MLCTENIVLYSELSSPGILRAFLALASLMSSDSNSTTTPPHCEASARRDIVCGRVIGQRSKYYSTCPTLMTGMMLDVVVLTTPLKCYFSEDLVYFQSLIHVLTLQEHFDHLQDY